MQTMSNTPRSIRPASTAAGNPEAYYDPSSKQIRYSKRLDEAGLFGTVIEGSLARLKSSKFLMGEILEIIDTPRQVKEVKPREPQIKNRHSTDPPQNEPEESKPPHPTKKPPQSTKTTPALSQIDLLEKQQNLHQLHSKQSLSILQMHQNEREIIKNANFPSERQREQARIEMEYRHERELLLLQDRQQRKQIDMMNEMLSGVKVREQSDETRQHQHQHVQQHVQHAHEQHETIFAAAEAAHMTPSIFPKPVSQGQKVREQNDLHGLPAPVKQQDKHERADELEFSSEEPKAAQVTPNTFSKPTRQGQRNHELDQHEDEQQQKCAPAKPKDATQSAPPLYPKHVRQVQLNHELDEHDQGQQLKFAPTPKPVAQITPNLFPKPVRQGKREEQQTDFTPAEPKAVAHPTSITKPESTSVNPTASTTDENLEQQQTTFAPAQPKVATHITRTPKFIPPSASVNLTTQSAQTADEPLLDKAILEKRKAEEIKALLRDKTLDRERRHNSLTEIKERYSQLFASLTNGGEQSIADRRRSELQAIMKDRTLTKEERLKKMSEVKAKYPVGTHGSRRATVDSGSRPAVKCREEANQPKRASIGKSVEEDFVRREHVQEKKKKDNVALRQGDSELEAARSSLTSRRPDARAKESTSREVTKEEFTASTNLGKRPKPVLPKEPSTRTVESEDEEDEIIPTRFGEKPKRVLPKEPYVRKVGSEDEEDYIECSTSPTNFGRGLEKSESARLFGDLSAPSSRSNSNRSMQLDPLETAEVNKTPIKSIIKLLKSNDPALSVLKLDGRGKIKDDDWEALFDTLESNTSLTHLSLCRCGLTDEKAMGLVLALVENSTLVELHLMTNREITEVTGKGLVKVLKESNSTLKQLDMSRTRVKKQTLKDIQEIMDDRDEEKKRAAAAALRALKVKALMKVTASDAVAKSKKMISLDLSSSDDESDENEASRSKRSKQKSGGGSLRKSDKSNKSAGSASSRNSGKGSKGVASSRGRGRGRGGANAAVRASVTARQMATLGGDIVGGVGSDPKTLREQRKLRGECLDCGQKCFEKSIFKSKPLTIPHKVFEGRCLKCRPM